jgi:molybdate transport system regulatory protein
MLATGRGFLPIVRSGSTLANRMASDPRRKLHLRVILREGAALGPGKVDLLEAIAETGSIRAAGNRFKMSYRRAWELVAELNGMFAAPLVVAEAGGRGGGRASLTPLGREVVKRYRTMEQKALAATRPEFNRLARRLK